MRARLSRRRASRGFVALAVLAGLFAFIDPASAVHDDGLFELDGNAVDVGDPGEDWNKVCPAGTAAGAPAAGPCVGGTTASAHTFVTDAVNAVGKDTTIFTTGGSKDDLNTTAWRHTTGSVPDKDELLHAFAARYDDTVYFGADRFITNGDAQIGFWFLQRAVAPLAGGTFSGQHSDGDILVLSDFSNGGDTSTIRVFRWNGPGGTIAGNGAINGTLDLLAGTVDEVADCDVVDANDDRCATVNSTSQPSPWAYTPKAGAPNSFPPGGFYEGGIDLAAFDLEDECFSSFIAETRSSTSVDATLKDFVGGSFASCQANITTAPSPGAGGTVTPGTNVTDTVTISGSGVGTPPTPTGNVTFFLCGPADLDPDATDTCDTGGAQVGSPVALAQTVAGTATATSANVNTSALTPGRYCFRVTWPGDANYEGPFSHHRNAGQSVDSECFNVATIPTNTVTTPVDGSGTPVTSIVLGGSIADRAVVTGNSTGGDPTGLVKFFLCGPADLDPDDSDTCDTGGTQVGTPAGGETLASDGVAGTFTSNVTSDSTTPTATGRYCFRADYQGSTVYDPSSDSAATECFNVIKLPTSTVTTPVDAAGDPVTSIVIGGTIHDHALVTGSAGGGDPTGTVQFFVCGPADLDPDDTDTCDTGGTQVGTPAAGETLVSDGVADTFTSSVTSEAFQPTGPGRWCFRAVYSGNTPYNGSSDSSTTECFLVVDTSTVSSAQRWLPNDAALVLLSNGSPASGSVTFTLYETSDCTGTAVSGQSYTDTLNAQGRATTTNTTYLVTADKTVSWLVAFTPSNQTTVQGDTHCETSSVTVNNN